MVLSPSHLTLPSHLLIFLLLHAPTPLRAGGRLRRRGAGWLVALPRPASPCRPLRHIDGYVPSQITRCARTLGKQRQLAVALASSA